MKDMCTRSEYSMEELHFSLSEESFHISADMSRELVNYPEYFDTNVYLHPNIVCSFSSPMCSLHTTVHRDCRYTLCVKIFTPFY